MEDRDLDRAVSPQVSTSSVPQMWDYFGKPWLESRKSSPGNSTVTRLGKSATVRPAEFSLCLEVGFAAVSVAFLWQQICWSGMCNELKWELKREGGILIGTS